MESWDIVIFLRCERDHPNEVSLRERDAAVGRPCAKCGLPLQARAERAREPRPPGPRRY